MEILVNRTIKTNYRTIGEFFVDAVRKYYSCEDKDRQIIGAPVALWKIKGQTAIPTGTYKIIMSYSNRFGRILPELLEVPGFDKIRIHNGNTEKDTEGCILIGLGMTNGGVTNSVAALDDFLPIIEAAWEKQEPITITVK